MWAARPAHIYQPAENFERAVCCQFVWFAHAQLRGDSVVSGTTASRTFSSTFVVGNPRDREATIELTIKRASVPRTWRLSVGTGDSLRAQGSLGAVEELEPGKRYQVRLSPKGQVRVASVLTPVGPVAENTTIRWAVEGRIDKELLGGIVLELKVPSNLKDLDPASADAVPPTRPRVTVMVLQIGLVVALLTLAAVTILFRRRSRARSGA